MFAEVVRTNRQRLGFTQEELASKAGLGVRTIRKIEAGLVGTPRPATVRLLAGAFGLVGTDGERFCQTAAGEPTDPPTRPNLPAQLPADVWAFTGRAEQLAHLDALLARASDQPKAVIISALSGTAGVGKTALAVHWAHRVADQFPDGQLYVNLHGYDPGQPMTPADALARFLTALAVPGQDIPIELDDRAARYRSEVASRRMLIVLDNAATAEQVRPLLPGTGSCAVVVTSRDSLAGLVAVNGVRRLDLDPLPSAEAVILLRRLIGRRIDAEPDAAATLAGQCARLPLALRVAAELAASRPASSLAELVAELGEQQHRLDLLDSGDPRATVRTVFSWSIQRLPPDAARMFRMLGLHPGPDFDPYAGAALANISLEEARRGLELLNRAHLVHPTTPGRYGMHDLLRAYAAELTCTQDTDQLRHAALTRLLDHYRHTASVAMDLAYPYERERRPRVPPSATATPEPSDPAEGVGWLDTELVNLLTAVQHTASHGWPEHTVDLSVILHRHLRTRGHYIDAEALNHQALGVARTIGDQAGELHTLNSLGDIHRMQGRYKQAIDHFGQALRIARTLGDHTGELDALIGLGNGRLRQGRLEQAIDHYRQALDIAQTTGDHTGELHAQSGLGNGRLRQGQLEQALDHYRQALDIAQTTGDHTGELHALSGLGWVRLQQGEHEQALDHYRQTLEIAQTTGHRTGELNARLGCADIHRLQGRRAHARDHYRQALEIAEATSHRDGEVGALIGLGHVYRQLGQYEQATESYHRVLHIAREASDGNWQFEAVHGLGRLHYATGRPKTALDYHHQALDLGSALAQPTDQARAHDGLAHAYRALGKPQAAHQHWQLALDILASLGTEHTEDEEASAHSIHAHLTSLAFPGS